MRGINPGLTMLVNNSARDTLFEQCMASKGYVYGDPIEARFAAVNRQIDWFTANPHGGLAVVNGQTISYRSAEIAAQADQFHQLFGVWLGWCLTHPDGGIIPDGAGDTLKIPRNRMRYVNRELMAAWERWKPVYSVIRPGFKSIEPASSAPNSSATH